jgi:hypothetical protein
MNWAAVVEHIAEGIGGILVLWLWMAFLSDSWPFK